MSEARAIDGDGSITLSCAFEDTANQVIFHHGAIAVQEDHRRSAALPDVVQPRAPRGHKLSEGRVTPLRPGGSMAGDKGRARKCHSG
jgi:hypothetical protein